MKIGYARVSTNAQDLFQQEIALQNAGCEKIFSDKQSGAFAERPGLLELIDFARPGDTIVVQRLDRLARSLQNLIATVNQLSSKDVSLCSLHETLDTATSGGKLIFHIFGALAEFERNLIRERTKAGLDAARIRGRLGGRPNKVSVTDVQLIKTLYENKSITTSEICNRFSMSKSTLYRVLK